jgi:putative chitinase
MDFDVVRPLFGGKLTQQQVDGINHLVSMWGRYGDGDRYKLSYLLATTSWETAYTMQPIHERGPKSYFSKYEPGTSIGKALGNTVAGDGYKFRGRGHVQLTGRRNYAKAGKAFGIDLIKEPDLALTPDVSARVLITGCLEGWFTGRSLGQYITPDMRDYKNARRVVNGLDKATQIAAMAKVFESALSARIPPPTPAQPRPTPATIDASVPLPQASFWVRLQALAGLFLAALKRAFFK